MIGLFQTFLKGNVSAAQDNSRIGATVVMPFQRRHAIKVAYLTSLRTELGSDADQLLVSYQVLVN